MRRTLALELVHATEFAAVAAAQGMGRGDERGPYEAAARVLRSALESARISGRLRVGADHGSGGSFALDPAGRLDEPAGELEIEAIPLEGTAPCASGGPNALSVLAATGPGDLLRVPPVYMDKIAVGPGAAGSIDLEAPLGDNLAAIARSLGREISDLTVVILDRPRHRDRIAEVREHGARIRLIGDGDVSAALAILLPESGVDVLVGIGGASQAVLSAAALKCAGGDLQARFVARGGDDRRLLDEHGIEDPDAVLTLAELVRGDAIVAATGVTRGESLAGVRHEQGHAITHSLVLRSETGSLRLIQAHHRLDELGVVAAT